MNDKVEGQKFSQLYLEKGAPAKDSNRARNRLLRFYTENFDDFTNTIVREIERETGAIVPMVMGYNMSGFFRNCELRDLLDTITIIFQYCRSNRLIKSANDWHEFVSKVFREENLGYQLDSTGGVHYFVDEEFERTRHSLVKGLSLKPTVLNHFERAYESLDSDPKDTSKAVLEMFKSVESLYKNIISAADGDRLNARGVRDNLKPRLEDRFSGDNTAALACEKMMESLVDWINAGHMYRHAQDTETPQPPPLDFAVLYLSQGAAFLRFLLPLTD